MIHISKNRQLCLMGIIIFMIGTNLGCSLLDGWSYEPPLGKADAEVTHKQQADATLLLPQVPVFEDGLFDPDWSQVGPS